MEDANIKDQENEDLDKVAGIKPLKCKHVETVEESGYKICCYCGQILQEVEFGEEIPRQIGRVGQIKSQNPLFKDLRNREVVSEKQLLKVLDSILTAVGLDNSRIGEHCVELINTIVRERGWQLGAMGRLKIGLAIAYSQIKERRIPVTLSMLCGMASQPMARIIAHYQHLVSLQIIPISDSASPMIFVERLMLQFPNVERRLLLEPSFSILDLCQDSLAPGRRPEPLALAVMIAVHESLIQDRHSINDLRSYARKSDLPFSTVYERYGEAKKALTRLAAGFGLEFKTADLHLHLELVLSLIKIHKTRMELPPAFAQSERDYRGKLVRLVNSKKRLLYLSNVIRQSTECLLDDLNRPSESDDFGEFAVDILVEEMLLKGFTDQEILDYL